jgi:hypothetical protein
MNQQLQIKLADILATIHNGIKLAGDFALEQLPEIAQQYIAYGRASHTVYLAIGIAIVAVLLWNAKKTYLLLNENPNKNFLLLPIYLASGFFSIALIANNLSNALLVWFAPKVWLLQEIAKLIK